MMIQYSRALLRKFVGRKAAFSSENIALRCAEETAQIPLHIASQGEQMNFLEGVALEELPSVVSERIIHVQKQVLERQFELSTLSFKVSPHQLDESSGLNEKIVLDGFSQQIRICRYLHKPMPLTDASKVQFVTILANLLGLETPIALVHRFAEVPASRVPSVGVSMRFLEGFRTGSEFDLKASNSSVIQYVLLSRWFNELIGNLHCWWGQLLVPSDAKRAIEHVRMVDFDEAFCNVAPEFLQHALRDKFGKGAPPLEFCQWLNLPFHFEDPIGWSPDHYDSAFTIYGPLIKLYLTGVIDLDMDAARNQICVTRHIPVAVIENVMEPFLQSSTDYYRNPVVFVPASENPKLPAQEFVRRFLTRLERSREQFCAFLDRLEEAKRNGRDELCKFYAQLMARPY